MENNKSKKILIPVFASIILFCMISLIVVIFVIYFYFLKPAFGTSKSDTVILEGETEFLETVSNLELCKRKTTEFIDEEEVIRINIPFENQLVSTAKYRIRFSSEYVYFVSAQKEEWRMWIEDAIAYVSAPAIYARASVDTSSIEASFKGGWLIMKEDKKLEALKKKISQIATERANSENGKKIIREICRKSLEDFIYKWFIKGKNTEVKAISVKFADENQMERLPNAL